MAVLYQVSGHRRRHQLGPGDQRERLCLIELSIKLTQKLELFPQLDGEEVGNIDHPGQGGLESAKAIEKLC